MLVDRIKILRRLKGLTQKEMATLLHKSQRTYSRIESGELAITAEDLVAIGFVLNCQPKDLLQENGIVNILKQYEKSDTNDDCESDVCALLKYNREMMQMIFDQQQKALDQTNQIVLASQRQMNDVFQEIIAIIKTL